MVNAMLPISSIVSGLVPWQRPKRAMSEPWDLVAHLAGIATNLTKALMVLTMYLRMGGVLVKSKIVRIGNSKGVRLPKPLLEQVGLVDEVDLEVRDGELVISPSNPVRAGWREAAALLAQRQEDEPLAASSPTRFDAEEWEW